MQKRYYYYKGHNKQCYRAISIEKKLSLLCNCFKEQKHLDEGSPERIYWHYGELMTLIDLRKGLDSLHSKISQIGH